MLGLMRVSKHRQIYVKQGEAYRRDVEEARSDAIRARAELRSYARTFVRSASVQRELGGGLHVHIEMTEHLTRHHTPDSLLRLIAEEIMKRIAGIGPPRDPRPDMRSVGG